MSGRDIPRDSDLEEQASKLNEGLKSCHALVSSYRTLLSSDPASDEPVDKNGPDLGEADIAEAE